MKITRKQFIRYLKEKNAYASWLNNTRRNMRLDQNKYFFEDKFNFNINKFIDYYIETGQPEEIIMVSFTWCETKEGEAFWLNIHNELRAVACGYERIEKYYEHTSSEEKAAETEMV